MEIEFNSDREVLKAALSKWGSELQELIAIEEIIKRCSEPNARSQERERLKKVIERYHGKLQRLYNTIFCIPRTFVDDFLEDESKNGQ